MSKKGNNGIDAEGEIVELTPKQLLPLLLEHAKAGESVGIEGPPGAAKSELVAQCAKAVNLHLYIGNCELEDSTDGKGLPFRDSENPHQVIWLKDRRYLMDHPVAFFHDELPRGMVAVQGTKASMLLENRIDDIYLPKGTWHVWAGNRTSDKAGANRVPTIIYNRCFMYAVRYDAESHIEHEIGQGNVDMLTIRYLRMKGDQAYSFDPAKKINSTPRAWSTIMRRLHTHPDTDFATIAGRIGKGFASELMAFRDLAPSLPSPEEVMLNPTKARVPDNVSAQFLVTDMLADHANKTSFDALVTYAKRLPSEMQAKFVKDSMIRTPEVASTKAFVEWGVKFAEVLR